MVFAETHHPARDDGNAADRSPASRGKKQAQEQSCTTPSRTNILTAGPSTQLLYVDQPLPKGKAWAKPMPSPQRAERPSAPSNDSATSNVTDKHQTLSETSQQWGEISHRLTAMDNWLLALEQQSPVTESQSPGPQKQVNWGTPQRTAAQKWVAAQQRIRQGADHPESKLAQMPVV